MGKKDRILYSLIELGNIIGLDLPLDDMLHEIGKKAIEVMEADRFSIFLYDPRTDELYTTVALGMGTDVIRIPADTGLAGYCFQAGEIVNLKDAHKDPRFNKDVDRKTGYRTKTLLTMPFYTKDSRRPLGVVQILNKIKGYFTKDDETFLRTFSNHAAVFIEKAQLQKARIEALEQSRQELERLNRAKSKALNHLSHEVRTPLAIIQGNVRGLKRKLSQQTPDIVFWRPSIEALERNLERLTDIQKDIDKIFKVSKELEAGVLVSELELLWRRMETLSEMPADIKSFWDTVKQWTMQHLPGAFVPLAPINLHVLAERSLRRAQHHAGHRDLQLQVTGDDRLPVMMNSQALQDVVDGILKNAIENTPDGGMISIVLKRIGDRAILSVKDSGVGIVEENQKYIFDGLFHTKDTDLYTSKRPYDFGAGGKGLDLLRARTYAQRFGFDLSMESRRCPGLPTEQDLCPGSITLCPNCKTPEDCLSAGGTEMTLSFPVIGSAGQTGQS
jgi:signal transduction histidine kinase